MAKYRWKHANRVVINTLTRREIPAIPGLGEWEDFRVWVNAGGICDPELAGTPDIDTEGLNLSATNIPVVSRTTPGMVPASPGGTSAFLRADGSWSSPPGGGGEAFPVGSVFISVVETNPATLLGYGTWAAFGAGRVLVGLDARQAEFDTVRETGGAKTHTLTVAEMPAHTHEQTAPASASGGVVRFATGTNASGAVPAGNNATQSAGGGGAHNNLQPYIVVHIWERTA